MSRAGYVPCRGGCGVREHRIGTAAERNCGRRATRSGAARRRTDTAPPGLERSGVDTLFDTVKALGHVWRAVRAWWGRTEAPTSLQPAPTPVDLHQKRLALRRQLKKEQPRLRGAELEARTDALMRKDLQKLNRRRAAWHRWHAPAGTPAPPLVIDPSLRARRQPPPR